MIYSAASIDTEPVVMEPETDEQLLARKMRSLDFHESKKGRHHGIAASQLRREVIRLQKKLMEQAS